MRNDVLEGQENKERKQKMKEQNSPVTHAPIILNDNDSDAQMQNEKKKENRVGKKNHGRKVRNMHRHTDQMVGGTFIRSRPKTRSPVEGISQVWDGQALAVPIQRPRFFRKKKAAPFWVGGRSTRSMYWSNRSEQSIHQSVESNKIRRDSTASVHAMKKNHQTPYFAGIDAYLDKNAGSVYRSIAKDGQFQVTERRKKLPPKT